jgi:hypothetical protein
VATHQSGISTKQQLIKAGTRQSSNSLKWQITNALVSAQLIKNIVINN